MTDMTTSPAHARPELGTAPRDHLWVLAVIAVAALAEVWASWVGIGAISGFPDLIRMHTDWVLAVVMEAYWAYALYAWLAASPGPKSRSFAMWSCAVVFGLSLIGQVCYHEMTVAPGMPIGRRVVVGFVTALPVTVLALIAVLIHLRHTDRADAAEAERAQRAAELEARRRAAAADERAQAEAFAADERTALRAQLADAQAALGPALERAENAERAAAEAAATADELARKLAAANAKNARSRARQKRAASPRSAAAQTRATEMPEDFDARAEALAILDAEPGISGAQLGPRVGMSKRWGQDFKRDLAGVAPPGPDTPKE